jgi:predicted amidophosphoribosyltransferase
MPALLRDAGCSALVKAVGYHAGQKQLPERLILLGKRCRDRELFRFFASDLQLKVWQALERVGGVGNACVTYVPRRRSAALQAGVDQGKELARALSSALELPFRCVLRNFAQAEQKKLDFADRAQNAQAAITVARRADLGSIQGKTVILVDDITTAGATLAAGCRVLLGAGAARVICCVVAHTQGENAPSGDDV